MRSISVPALMSILLLLPSCGDNAAGGGDDDDGPAPADAASSTVDADPAAPDADPAAPDAAPGAPDASPTAPDAGSGGGDGVACGDETCTGAQICCVTGGPGASRTCTAADDCGGSPSIPAVRFSDPPRRSLEHRGAGPLLGPAPVFAVSRTVVGRAPRRGARHRHAAAVSRVRGGLVGLALATHSAQSSESELSLSKELGDPAGLDGCSSGAAARRFAPSAGSGWLGASGTDTPCLI